ncbi:UNVERIFIED_CONTAM: hypothetical protein Slati_3676800, partial [Sesamum latifolium]
SISRCSACCRAAVVEWLHPTQLGVVARLVDIKADGHISERMYDRISQWADDILPRYHTLPLDYYNTKKLIKDLGLPLEEIDTCRNGCMLYWKDDIDLDYCNFYGESRYHPTRERNPNHKKTPYAILSYLPITHRLQRLYASQATEKQMTWHANHQTEEGSMCHPSNAEAWRHFHRTHPNFAVELRNVRLSLCMDEFALHGHSSYTDTDSDFYGILKEVIQLDNPLIPNMQIVLFKCRWVYPLHGMKVHPRYHLVDVNFKKGTGMSRATNGESDDEPDEDSFDEDYKTEDNNYD